MRFLKLLIFAGHIFATGIQAGNAAPYSPKNDPSIAHLLLKDPNQIDILAIRARVLHEYKRDGKKVSRAFMVRFKQLKAERAAQIAAGNVPTAGQSQGGISKRNQGKSGKQSGAGKKGKGRNTRNVRNKRNGVSKPTTSNSSQQVRAAPPQAIQTPQPFQQTPQPVPFEDWNKPRPFGSSNQPSSFQPQPPQGGDRGAERGLNRGTWDPEADFMLSNFTDKFIERVYRFEEKRRRMRGTPGGPRPAPVPAQLAFPPTATMQPKGPQRPKPAVQQKPAVARPSVAKNTLSRPAPKAQPTRTVPAQRKASPKARVNRRAAPVKKTPAPVPAPVQAKPAPVPVASRPPPPPTTPPPKPAARNTAPGKVDISRRARLIQAAKRVRGKAPTPPPAPTLTPTAAQPQAVEETADPDPEPEAEAEE